MKRVCVVVATLFTARAFLLGHLSALGRRYELSIAANGRDDTAFGDTRVRLIAVPIERKIAPLSDLRALAKLYAVFKSERFDAVHSVTPKAGLLAMLASRLAGTPVRVHTFTGQVWATKTGAPRTVLKTMDRLLAAAATHVLADSASQLAFLRREGIVAADRGEVLAKGSISGVDPARFRADAAVRAAARAELRIPDAALVYVFVGRLSRDKGVLDLAHAFSILAQSEPGPHLLLVGPDEEALASAVYEAAGKAASRIHIVGMTDAPERYMAAGDVFCLPSHREGFGAVVIEAAAAGLPAIGSRIYGVTDAIEEDKTGLLVPPGDVESLAGAMLALARDDGKRHALARAARTRALRDYSSEAVTSALVAFYERVLPPGDAASSAVRPGL
jgi:glycosyltransferase involved in cell wall biosynthesis